MSYFAKRKDTIVWFLNVVVWHKFMQPRGAMRLGQQRVKRFDYQLLLVANLCDAWEKY